MNSLFKSIDHAYKLMYLSLFLLRFHGGFPYNCVYKTSNISAGFIVPEGAFLNRKFKLVKYCTLYNVLICSLTAVYFGILSVYQFTIYDFYSTMSFTSWLNKEIELVTFVFMIVYVINRKSMLYKLVNKVNAIEVDYDPRKLSLTGSKFWHLLTNHGLYISIIITATLYSMKVSFKTIAYAPFVDMFNFLISVEMKWSSISFYRSIISLLSSIYVDSVHFLRYTFKMEKSHRNHHIRYGPDFRLTRKEELKKFAPLNQSSYKRIAVLKKVYAEILNTYKVRQILQDYVGLPISFILLHTLMTFILGNFNLVSNIGCKFTLDHMASLANIVCLILFLCNVVDVPSILKNEVSD